MSNLISVGALREQLGASDMVVIDCRFNLMEPEQGREMWQEAHIPGAHYAHLDDDLAGPVTPATGRHPLPDTAELAKTLGRWGISGGSKVVVYDDAGGAIAARLWWLLRWLGHEDVQVLNGGWQAWQRVGEVSAEEPELRSGEYPGNPGQMPVLQAAAIQPGLEQGLCLIDARAAARFRGEVEPIDPVAGHVPGAINRDFALNLDENGLFKSPEALKAEFAVLDGFAAGLAACMCGSGVTACHDILAAEEAGFPAPALYVGSWSGWIRDPARPVATG